MRLIAFYLPQYHPIPENDRWWGKGFTDWTNVVGARPLFPGHYQPHLPTDLGFYDLRLPEIREAQAAMAAEYGIHGFCYHYYWFNGQRLLERPYNEMLGSGNPRFPFCLCWANENWTRRWDGQDYKVLIEQKHSYEDDGRFIDALLPAFRDPRYITVNGKPLLIIYYSDLFSNPAKTTDMWRTRVRAAGFPDLYLVRAETHTLYGHHPDPRVQGFDAALEFPPHAFSSSRLRPTDPDWKSDTGCLIFDYHQLLQCALEREAPDYKLFRGVMPSWDNSPRRRNGAYIFAHSSPELYGRWLADSIAWTRIQHAGDEQIIFINAWNEWAEGCHLEPDQRYGRKYLEATRKALFLSENKPSANTWAHAHPPLAATGRPVGPQPVPVMESEDVQFECRLVPVPRTLDIVLAEYLLANHVKFRRVRRAIYNFIKPLWRAWLALTSRT